jgi:L-lactate utilization protein LutC
VNREDLKLLGTDKETQLLLPDITFYKEFALDCSRQQITVDLFSFATQFTDIATLGKFIYWFHGNAQVACRSLLVDNCIIILDSSMIVMERDLREIYGGMLLERLDGKVFYV